MIRRHSLAWGDRPLSQIHELLARLQETPDDDAIIEAFLDRLIAAQQEDGGWPIDWPAPGTTAIHEWRAIRTLEALGTLSAYGRL